MQENILLSAHFQLREFTESATARKHGIVNEPPPEAVENLRRLCEGTLEPLREKLGGPIVITSGYRTKALNDILVHAARKSQHMEGCAADFYVSSPAESADSAESSASTGSGAVSRRELLIQAFRLIILEEDIDFDQLILYPSFIHVSYVSRARNRRKITTANGLGPYCAVTRAQALAIN